MKVVLIRFKGEERREFALQDGVTSLGRRPEADLRIAARDVSRRHCQIVISDDGVLVRDLGSSNGTFVNDKRVAETALSAGDRLSVGPIAFVVQIDGKPADIKPLETQAEVKAKPAVSLEDDEDVFELGEEDFDIDDAISSLGELDEDTDLP